jgi:hypothetical protein
MYQKEEKKRDEKLVKLPTYHCDKEVTLHLHESKLYSLKNLSLEKSMIIYNRQSPYDTCEYIKFTSLVVYI